MANLESIPYKTLQAVARKAGIRPLNQARASLEIAIANAARTIAIAARLAARTPSCGKHTSNEATASVKDAASPAADGVPGSTQSVSTVLLVFG